MLINSQVEHRVTGTMSGTAAIGNPAILPIENQRWIYGGGAVPINTGTGRTPHHGSATTDHRGRGRHMPAWRKDNLQAVPTPIRWRAALTRTADRRAGNDRCRRGGQGFCRVARGRTISYSIHGTAAPATPASDRDVLARGEDIDVSAIDANAVSGAISLVIDQQLVLAGEIGDVKGTGSCGVQYRHGCGRECPSDQRADAPWLQAISGSDRFRPRSIPSGAGLPAQLAFTRPAGEGRFRVHSVFSASALHRVSSAARRAPATSPRTAAPRWRRSVTHRQRRWPWPAPQS